MLRNRHVANSAWAIAENLCYPVLTLAATPILLRSLGVEVFGLWTFLTAVSSLGAAATAGTSTAIIKLISEASAKRDLLGIQATAQGSLAISICCGSVFVLATAIFLGVYPTDLLRKMGSRPVVSLVIILACLIASLEQIDAVYGAMLKGAEKFNTSAKLELGLKTAQTIVLVMVAITVHDLVALAVSCMVAASLRLFVKIRVAQATWKDVNFAPSIESMNHVFRLSRWGWLQGIGGVLFGTADRLIVGSALGASSLAYYSVAVQLAAQTHSIAAAGLSVISPIISRKYVTVATASGLRAILSKAIKLNLCACLLIGVVLGFSSKEIFRIWVGTGTAEAIEGFFPFLLVSYLLLSLNIVPFYVLSAFGEMKRIAVYCILAGVLGMLGSLILISSAGLVGASIARAIYAVVTLLLYPRMLSVLRSHPS